MFHPVGTTLEDLDYSGEGPALIGRLKFAVMFQQLQFHERKIVLQHVIVKLIISSWIEQD